MLRYKVLIRHQDNIMKRLTSTIFHLLLFLCLTSATSLGTIFDLDKDEIEGFMKDFEKDVDLTGSRGIRCKTNLANFLTALNSKEEWALRMADASGKLASGLLQGNLNSLGSVDECIQVNHNSKLLGNINGKYCSGLFPIADLEALAGSKASFERLREIEKVKIIGDAPRLTNVVKKVLSYRIGLCLPDSCSALEFESFVLKILDQQFDLKNITLNVDENLCLTTQKTPWTVGAWVTIGILSLAVLLAILSTGYDVWFLLYSGRDPKTKNQLLAACSFYTNSKKLVSINQNPGRLASLNGIRVLSMGWVILGHRYFVTAFYPIENTVDLIDWTKTYSSSFILSASVSVDTFFVMSGVLMAYLFFTKFGKQKKFNFLMFYVHRYLRLAPPLVIMILINAFLLKHMGKGPLWWQISQIAEACQKNWWATLLFINNYVNVEEICVGQTWYLSADMQIYVLTPLLLVPLLWRPKWGLVWASFWTLFFFVLIITLSTVYDWDPGLNPVGDIDTVYDYYFPTHTRATPYLMGFLAGYIMANSKKDLKINKILVFIGWITALGIMAAVILGGHNLTTLDHVNTKLEKVTYLSLSRPGWAIAILWMIVANFYGYGGPINWFLSLDIFQIFARISYSMYLIHLQMQFVITSAQKNTSFFSTGGNIHRAAGDIMCVVVLSYFFCLLFESPIINIEKVLLLDRTKKEAPKQEKLNGTLQNGNADDIPELAREKL